LEVVMKATEDLKKEHEDIKAMLRILDEVSDKLDAGEKVNPEHLDGILEFIQGFADKCHHAKEEDLLFPAMEKAGVPRERGPIGVMLYDHGEGRKFVKRMKEGVAKFKDGDANAAQAITENARKYTELLTLHIHKEDNILYPIADNMLSAEAQKELEKAFEKVEIEVIGPGQHERFHRLLHQLEAAYPKKD
jgi:hemerythrin-like domain-containing protein